MKIVKNSCYGGFGLSLLAQKKYLERKGKEMFAYKQTKYNHQDGVEEYVKLKDLSSDDILVSVLTVDLGDVISKLEYPDGSYFMDSDIERTDRDLVEVVEELGKEADGPYTRLEVVEIPDGVEYEIDEYDGVETIREKHRSW